MKRSSIFWTLVMGQRCLALSGSILLVSAVLTMYAAPSRAATMFDVQFTDDTGSTVATAPAVSNTVNTDPTDLGEWSPDYTVVAQQGHTDPSTSVTLGGTSNPVAVLIANGSEWSPGIYFKGVAGEQSSSGKVSIMMDVLLDSSTSTGGWSFFFARNNSGQNIAALLVNYDKSGGVLLNYDAPDGSTTQSPAFGAPAGQVLHMSWLLDFDQLTQSISINGGPETTGTLPVGAAYNQLVINPTGGDRAGTLALDNVKINNVPEPGSLTLLGLGGLLMLRRAGGQRSAA